MPSRVLDYVYKVSDGYSAEGLGKFAFCFNFGDVSADTWMGETRGDYKSVKKKCTSPAEVKQSSDESIGIVPCEKVMFSMDLSEAQVLSALLSCAETHIRFQLDAVTDEMRGYPWVQDWMERKHRQL